MIYTIVVPLDRSELAWQAMPVATRIARASESTLQLVGVVTLPLDAFWLSVDPTQRLMRLEQEGPSVRPLILNRSQGRMNSEDFQSRGMC